MLTNCWLVLDVVYVLAAGKTEIECLLDQLIRAIASKPPDTNTLKFGTDTARDTSSWAKVIKGSLI